MSVLGKKIFHKNLTIFERTLIILICLFIVFFLFYFGQVTSNKEKAENDDFYNIINNLTSNDITSIDTFELEGLEFGSQKRIIKDSASIKAFSHAINFSIPWRINHPFLSVFVGLKLTLKNANIIFLECYLISDVDSSYKFENNIVFCKNANSETYPKKEMIEYKDKIIIASQFKSRSLYHWFLENDVHF